LNCDRIAPVYRWLEYLAFGRELERRRFRFLSEVAGAQRALVLGDGDGRFLARITEVSKACGAHKVSIDYVDVSARMLQLARARGGGERVAYHRADALTMPLAPQSYDLIATHFFLDCFNEADMERIVDRVQEAARPGALWVISEFREPRWAKPILGALYLFFRATTGLETNRLVDHRPLLQRHGFELLREETSRGGLLASELWVKCADHGC
jgi:SAM-dependent methyltransferase